MWFYYTKNSKMGFCLRGPLSLSKRCIHILCISSLPIFSSYSVFPLCKVECRITVERHKTKLRTHPDISTRCLHGGVIYPTPPLICPEKTVQSSTRFPESQPALKVFRNWMVVRLISLSRCTLFPQRPSNQRSHR